MNWDEFWEETNTILVLIILIGSVAGIVYGSVRHESMMHNVDLVFNAVKDPYKLSIYVDEYEVGKTISFKEMYIGSMINLRIQTRWIAFFGLGMGMAVGMLISQISKQLEKKYDERKQRSKSVQTNRRKKSKTRS